MMEDELVRLSPLSEKDIEDTRHFSRMNRESLLRRFPITDYEHREWFKNPPKDCIYLSINEIEFGNLVGVVGIRNLNWVDRNGDMIILVWMPGQGFGLHAVKLFTHYLFKDLGLHKIYLRVLESNMIARKCYEKAGFKLEGVLDDEVFVDGEFKNIIRMGLINE